MSEREIMYKLLFDMRKDLNDLKEFVLGMADVSEIPSSARPVSHAALAPSHHEDEYMPEPRHGNPIVITQPVQRYAGSEEIHEEESLSIADKEKELIMKALKKHKGKRKEAAFDLGISERTLYRKIKEYDIKE